MNVKLTSYLLALTLLSLFHSCVSHSKAEHRQVRLSMVPLDSFYRHTGEKLLAPSELAQALKESEQKA